MRKPSKAELAERNARLQTENTVLAIALQAMATGEKPDAIERVKGSEKGERYEYRLLRGSAAHGGIVVQIFHCAGQRPYVTAHYLSDLHTYTWTRVRAGIEGSTEHGAAIERLVRRTYDLARKAS